VVISAITPQPPATFPSAWGFFYTDEGLAVPGPRSHPKKKKKKKLQDQADYDSPQSLRHSRRQPYSRNRMGFRRRANQPALHT
jgi:hypothetical protein